MKSMSRDLKGSKRLSRRAIMPSPDGAPATSVRWSPGKFLSKYLKDCDRANVLRYAGVYEGKGAIDVKFFFRNEGSPEPARILIYTIPPGAGEGVHVHRPGDSKSGSFDEFYYILSGSGEMQIEDEKIPVTAGDHVFIPNGVAHGIENNSAAGDLKVYLLAVKRD
jgi:oxalate decarboxylase/phosphoglucose isomerase-like protein (cupin superfamily)